MISLQNLLDNTQCDEALRQARWPDGVRGPYCAAATVTRQGRDTTQLARCRRLKGARGRGTLATEKPPIFGLIQRGGAVVIRRVENVQQATLRPRIQTFIAPGSRVQTDEYTIYNPLKDWGLIIIPGVIAGANPRVTRTAMASMRFM